MSHGPSRSREATETYAGVARDLREWGFNLNLGPVVDVDVNPDNPIIGALGRSFSGDPGVVAAYAAAFVTGHRGEGVLTALKHFPGMAPAGRTATRALSTSRGRGRRPNWSPTGA